MDAAVLRKWFLAALVIFYIPVAYFGFGSLEYNNDEFVYFLIGREIAAARIPYVDFFCAHMPLMIYPVALSFKIFGVGVFAGKLVPIVSSFALLVIVFLTGERIRPYSGVIAACILFLCPMFQVYNHRMYGLMIASALFMVAFYAHISGRRKLCGFFCVMSLFARLNLAPLVLGLFILNLKNKDFMFGALFGLPLFGFFLVPGFADQTILYHLSKTPFTVGYKLASIWGFFTRHWYVILLGAYSFSGFRRDKNLRDLFFLSVLFFLFTFLAKNLFDFYLFFGLPLIALSAALARPWFSGWWKVLALACVIWVALNGEYLVQSYAIRYELTSVVDVFRNNTGGEGGVVCFSKWCEYLLFTSGAGVGSHTIDLADARMMSSGQDVVSELSQSLKSENQLVAVDLKEVNMFYSRGGLDFSDVLDTLFTDYFPITYLNWNRVQQGPHSWWMSINHLVFFKPANKVDAGTLLNPANTSSTAHFLETYLFLNSTLGERRLEFVSEIPDFNSEDLNVPPYISGANEHNITLLTSDVIRWPAGAGTHYLVGESPRYYVWVVDGQPGILEFFIITREGDELTAFSHATYDVEKGYFTGLRVFSKLAERTLTGYMPTYTQKTITQSDYELLKRAS